LVFFLNFALQINALSSTAKEFEMPVFFKEKLEELSEKMEED